MKLILKTFANNLMTGKHQKPRDSYLMLVLFSNSDVLKKETPYAQGWEQGGYTKVTLYRNYNKITVEELIPYDMLLNVLDEKELTKHK